MKIPRYPRRVVLTASLVITGLALAHAVSLLAAADGPLNGFLVGLVAASVLPYGVCLVLLKWRNNVGAALGAALAAAVVDVAMYWSVFVQPKSSTAALGLLFAPVWKLAVALPVGGLVGLAIDAALSRKSRS